MATFAFSPATEEEFQAYVADYRSSNRATGSFEEGYSSGDEEKAAVTPTVDESAAGGSTAGTDDIRVLDQLEDQQVNTMVNKSCGCKLGPKGTACSAQFTRKYFDATQKLCVTG